MIRFVRRFGLWPIWALNSATALVLAWLFSNPDTTRLLLTSALLIVCMSTNTYLWMALWRHRLALRLRAYPPIKEATQTWARLLAAHLCALGILPNDGTADYHCASGLMHHATHPKGLPMGATAAMLRESVAQSLPHWWHRCLFRWLVIHGLDLPVTSAHDRIAAAKLLATHHPIPPQEVPV